MAAGSIAMGLGGFMAARSEEEHYRAEVKCEQHEIATVPEHETAEVRKVFAEYGLEGDAQERATAAITSQPDVWLMLMMPLELGLQPPDPRRALQSALAIGGAYIAGGMIPLAPYTFALPIQTALPILVAVTLVALLIFGAVKARFTGVPMLRGALQTMLVGGIAAGAAFVIARLVSGIGGA